MLRKRSLICVSVLSILLIGMVIKTSALTINHETFQTIEMVGKYQTAFATSANVYGCEDNIHGQRPVNTPVRLSGDGGGRISTTSSSGLLIGGGGNSSSATLNKPTSNSSVAHAYLIQEAYYEDGREAILTNQAMTLKGPAGGSVKASSGTLYTSDNQVGVTVTDVTSFVRGQGWGTYQGWDIPYLPRTNPASDQIATWKLIVICEDDTLPIRMVRLKLGSRSISSGTKITVSIDGDGIKTKSVGTVTGQILIGGSGGDPDWHGSHFDLQPSPSSGIVRLSTGPTGNLNHADNFFEGIVTQNGVQRSDAKVIGYRNSDNVPFNNDDMVLMNANKTQSNAQNGHNAYFVNNSPKMTLTAVTEAARGNLSVFGMVADIDSASYTSSMSHTSGTLYQNSPITMIAHVVNNTEANKSNLGVTGGYVQIKADSNLTLDAKSISAVYTHNGSRTTLPSSMISVSGNTITVKFGVNTSGISYRNDSLDITYKGSTAKEQLTLNNTTTMYATNWIDESGSVHSFGKTTAITSAKDSLYISYNSPPVITASAKTFYEGEYTEKEWNDTLRMSGVSASDTEDGTLTSKITVEDNVVVNKNGTYKATYSVTDKYGKTTNKEVAVTVKYNNPPVVNAINQSFYQGEHTQAEWRNTLKYSGMSATDTEDGSLTSKVTIEENLNVMKPGAYPVKYSVTDAYGKSTSKTVTVTVKYNNPPVITANNQSFYENQYDSDDWKDNLLMKDVSASDTEDGNLTSKIKVIEDNVDPSTPGSYPVKYSVTDKWGKTTEKTITVTVKYNNPPVITASNQAFFEGEHTHDEWKNTLLKKGISASDKEDGNITDKINVIKDDVIVDKPGTYKVTYQVEDQWGKGTTKDITVTVKYNHPPVIISKDFSYYEGEISQEDWTRYRKQDVSASDEEDGSLTDQVKIIKDNVDVSVPGIYHIEYEVSDALGKTVQQSNTVEIKYNHYPVIETENIVLKEGEYDEDGLLKLILEKTSSSDTEDGDKKKQLKIIKNEVDPSKPGAYEVTFEVTDAYGKTTTKTIDVTVLENQLPTLQIFAPSKRFIAGEYTEAEWQVMRMDQVTAHDREDDDLTSEIKIIKDSTEVTVPGDYEVLYEVTDKWGKTAQKTAKVTVEPNQAPEIYAEDRWFKTTDKVTNQILLKNVFAYDDHDGDISNQLVIASNQVQSGIAGDYQVTYQVSDRFGAVTTKTVNIHIEGFGYDPTDPEPPIITDPDATFRWNGRQIGEVEIYKLLEDNDQHPNAWKDVTFGVYSAEDQYVKGDLVLKKDSLVGLIKLDGTHGQAYLSISGKYYIKELSTNYDYNLPQDVYYFDFVYE